jgi:hypothetical protein
MFSALGQGGDEGTTGPGRRYQREWIRTLCEKDMVTGSPVFDEGSKRGRQRVLEPLCRPMLVPSAAPRHLGTVNVASSRAGLKSKENSPAWLGGITLFIPRAARLMAFAWASPNGWDSRGVCVRWSSSCGCWELPLLW